MARIPLVGRGAEVEVLTEAVHDVRGGGALVLIVGEPGIGKSRLADEAARIAGAAGLATVWGRAWEAGGAPAFWPWICVLRALGAPDAATARLAGGDGDQRAASLEDRFLLFDATVRELAAATRTVPALVILEDLHAADEASLRLLAFVADQLRGMPLLVVGTYRDVEARMAPAAGLVLERLARTARVITPRRLARADIAELAVGLDAETVDALLARSEGNPLFVTELLRVLARRGTITIPAGVRTAIREHLRGLPAELPPVLELAAVIGREFAAVAVAELCGRPVDEVLDALALAVEVGVLVERAPGRFAFAHGLIAETLHHDLPAARRAQLHLQVADALERIHRDDPSAPLAELAHHMFEAGAEHAARAVEVAQRAADQARRQLAYEPAAVLIERALAIAPPGNASARFELLRLLGEVRLLSDDARGRDAAREAAAIARSIGSAELLARAALTYGGSWSFGYTDQVLVQLLEEALAALPPGDSHLRARMMARLASALQPTRDTEQPMAVARAAIAMADRLGDDRTRLDVLFAACGALAMFGPPEERRTLNLAALALAERFDEPMLALRTRQRLVFDHAELGDLPGFVLHHRGYDELAERLRLPRHRWPSAMMRAMLALAQGRLADHEAAVAEAVHHAAEAGDPLIHNVMTLGHGLLALTQRGDRAQLDRERSRYSDLVVWGQGRYHEIRAALHARLGELDDARGILTRDLVEAVRLHRHLTAMTEAADAIWRLGDRELAAMLYDPLAAEGGRLGALHTHGFVITRPAAHAAMQLAATLGDLAAARRHFEVAGGVLRAMNARPLEAWLLLDFAIILTRTGDAPARDEAARLLVQARASAAGSGVAIEPWIDAAQAGLAGTPSSPVDDHLRLHGEGEVWILDGLGVRCQLKTSKGVEWLARLLAEPGRELHVFELIGEGEGSVDAGDAGEVLDAEAKAAYKARLRALHEELAEAEQWNDTARVERAREEIEALEAELSRAIGLGGRSRRAGRAAERARVNVQRRIADAIRRVTECAPELGHHLAAAIRTGIYCSYAPERARRQRT